MRAAVFGWPRRVMRGVSLYARTMIKNGQIADEVKALKIQDIEMIPDRGFRRCMLGCPPLVGLSQPNSMGHQLICCATPRNCGRGPVC